MANRIKHLTRTLKPRLLYVAVAIAVGITIALIFLPSVTPKTLAANNEAVLVPVTKTASNDAKSVNLLVQLGGAGDAKSPVSGKVTRSDCAVGQTLTSGTSNISVDGKPLLNISTTTPLYRSLNANDKGDDVRSLQAELRNLQYNVPDNGTFDSATIASIHDLLAKNGIATSGSTLDLSNLIWFPSHEFVVKTCSASPGDNVHNDTSLMTSEASIMSAKVDSIPTKKVAGERTVNVDEVSLTVDDQGSVTDAEQLSKIANTQSYKQAVNTSSMGQSGSGDSSASMKSVKLAAKYQLLKSIDNYVVSPSSVQVDGEKACVFPEPNKPVSIVVLGSELGRTFVQFDKLGSDENAPAEVLNWVAKDAKCM